MAYEDEEPREREEEPAAPIGARERPADDGETRKRARGHDGEEVEYEGDPDGADARVKRPTGGAPLSRRVGGGRPGADARCRCSSRAVAAAWSKLGTAAGLLRSGACLGHGCALSQKLSLGFFP